MARLQDSNANLRLQGIADPIDDYDAVNKRYYENNIISGKEFRDDAEYSEGDIVSFENRLWIASDTIDTSLNPGVDGAGWREASGTLSGSRTPVARAAVAATPTTDEVTAQEAIEGKEGDLYTDTSVNVLWGYQNGEWLQLTTPPCPLNDVVNVQTITENTLLQSSVWTFDEDNFQGAELLITVRGITEVQLTKILLSKVGTVIVSTEYGETLTGDRLVDFDFDIEADSDGVRQVRLLSTPVDVAVAESLEYTIRSITLNSEDRRSLPVPEGTSVTLWAESSSEVDGAEFFLIAEGAGKVQTDKILIAQHFDGDTLISSAIATEYGQTIAGGDGAVIATYTVGKEEIDGVDSVFLRVTAEAGTGGLRAFIFGADTSNPDYPCSQPVHSNVTVVQHEIGLLRDRVTQLENNPDGFDISASDYDLTNLVETSITITEDNTAANPLATKAYVDNTSGIGETVTTSYSIPLTGVRIGDKWINLDDDGRLYEAIATGDFTEDEAGHVWRKIEDDHARTLTAPMYACEFGIALTNPRNDTVTFGSNLNVVSIVDFNDVNDLELHGVLDTDDFAFPTVMDETETIFTYNGGDEVDLGEFDDFLGRATFRFSTLPSQISGGVIVEIIVTTGVSTGTTVERTVQISLPYDSTHVTGTDYTTDPESGTARVGTSGPVILHTGDTIVYRLITVNGGVGAASQLAVDDVIMTSLSIAEFEAQRRLQSTFNVGDLDDVSLEGLSGFNDTNDRAGLVYNFEREEFELDTYAPVYFLSDDIIGGNVVNADGSRGTDVIRLSNDGDLMIPDEGISFGLLDEGVRNSFAIVNADFRTAVPDSSWFDFDSTPTDTTVPSIVITFRNDFVFTGNINGDNDNPTMRSLGFVANATYIIFDPADESQLMVVRASNDVDVRNILFSFVADETVTGTYTVSRPGEDDTEITLDFSGAGTLNGNPTTFNNNLTTDQQDALLYSNNWLVASTDATSREGWIVVVQDDNYTIVDPTPYLTPALPPITTVVASHEDTTSYPGVYYFGIVKQESEGDTPFTFSATKVEGTTVTRFTEGTSYATQAETLFQTFINDPEDASITYS